MTLTNDERQGVAKMLSAIADKARDAAQIVRQDDAPLQPVGALCVEIQADATEVVRTLLREIVD